MEHVKNLIPHDANITEQFQAHKQFMQQIWLSFGVDANTVQIDLDQLLERSGVKCHYIGTKLAGFHVVNSKQYVIWILQCA